MKKRFSQEQIVRFLKEREETAGTIPDVYQAQHYRARAFFVAQSPREGDGLAGASAQGPGGRRMRR